MTARGPLVAILLAVLAAGPAACKASRAQVHGGHQDEGAPPAAAHEHDGEAGAPRPEVPTGYSAISVEPARAAAIGLTTARVEERAFFRRLRTTAIVAVDETRTAHIHSKVRGWIDGIRVDYVGQKVATGQLLCAIYSQEVHAAEIEYVALLGRVHPETSPPAEIAAQEQRAHEALVAAARRRLRLWDVPSLEIERLEASREPRRTFPLLAPRAGVVVGKQALDGMYLEPSVELYTISDLSRVWVLADIYESDVAAVHLGQEAELEIQGVSAPIRASVAFLPPTIDEPTRTLKVRFDLANEGGQLRPGAFATATMDLHLGRGLAVPEDAVIRTGTRAIVFIVHDGTHVVPREISLGPLAEGFYRVDAGLAPGDLVATGAQFLLDSESRLRATGGPGAGHGGH